MSNIGFDFGTTNSIISYHDSESGTLNCFRNSASSTEYIPTVVAFEVRKGQEKVTIGNGAKIFGDGAPNVYGKFKLRLGSLFDTAIPGKVQDRTAHEVAAKYIGKLLDDFREKNTIENMVMTIPQVWYSEQSNYTARENIKSLLQELGLSPEQFRFQSEPVAAAAYFCWQWQKNENSPYDGNVLVIDFGGGTLDVTLCKVENGKKIRTVESYDSLGDEEKFEYGHAGSAFISKVIELLCAENGISLDENSLSLARNKFEEFLIERSNSITETMREYIIDPESTEDEEQFLFNLPNLNNCEVRCEHLLNAFKEVNESILEKAINQIMKSEFFDSKNVKVILVGGFSNFCCVENKVRAMFNSNSSGFDPRFPKQLTNENRALAIAKGAALIADGQITVDPIFPYEFGIIVGSLDKETLVYVDEYVPLIKKNALSYEYKEPVYSNVKISVMPDVNDLRIRMYRTTGGEKFEFSDFNRNLQEIFPLSDSKQVYQIGISLDDDMIPTIHAKNEDGTVKSSSLNKILERIAIRKV